MQCPGCGETIEDPDRFCTSCGAVLADAAPHARRVRAGFALALIAAFLVVFAAALLRPAGPSSTPLSSSEPTRAVEPTPTVDPERVAVEKTIRGFYATVDAGTSVTVSPYVYDRGRGGPEPRRVEATGTTTFAIARAVIGTGTADVYGRESRDVIALQRAEVEFRLRRIDGTWLISSWQVAVEETITPQALQLSDITARDVVGTVLQARQSGDATTMRLLTTEALRLRHSSWMDGTDQSALLLGFSVTGARKQGSTYVVTATEKWLPKTLTTKYTVIMTNGEILVDAWTFK